MVNELMVELSRWQFAATSLYHFIFVPLTLGISWLVFIMELVYVSTGKVIYRDMAKFWGKLFGINFAIGVATGITLEFEFGTNWSNYSHYVGDIFGAPLALEGLMAFFLESTFIGLMFTGWNRFSKRTHLLITFLTALGSNLSAMWILIANGWMQYPEFSEFSPERMRMEMVDFWGLIFSDVAQAKFLHTVTAGYTTAAVFVISISAFLMLKRKSLQFAKRSMTIAIVFGLAALGGAGLSGDISAVQVTQHQPAKLAAMEAEYHTQTPPASWSLFAIPDEENMDTIVSIKIPALLGIIATHSLDTEVIGLRDLVIVNEQRIRNGIIAHRALTEMRKNGSADEANLALFKEHQKDFGYGLLLVQHAVDPLNPTEEEIKVAARNSVPPVWVPYFAFRAMLGLAGLLGLFFMGAAWFLWFRRDLHTRSRILKIMVWAIPLPFLSCEMGWIVAEIGRQPWAIQDILPTFLATSSLSPIDVGISLICFIGIYTVLLIIEMKLMIKAVKAGPDLTDPEPDGKGYPPLPPAPASAPAEDSGCSCCSDKTENNAADTSSCGAEEKKAEESAVTPAEEDKRAEESAVAPAEEDNKAEESAVAPAEEDKKSEESVVAPAEEDKKSEESAIAPAEEENKAEEPIVHANEEKKAEETADKASETNVKPAGILEVEPEPAAEINGVTPKVRRRRSSGAKKAGKSE